ncbi:MAG: MBL fold metallo-hydrolase [bacterium]
MKISFHGAVKEVTGSCILVEDANTKFLVDCGLFQGGEFSTQDNFQPFAFNPQEIEFVLLTHAHADHCGRLPKLYKDGFRGKIYCTPPTRDLAEIILLDSANIIAREAKRYRRPQLFSEKDVRNLMANFSTLNYREDYEISPYVRVKLRDAGHILGSAILEVSLLQENGKFKKLVFSGDLGNSPAPIVRETGLVNGADAVIIESTYGGKIHEPAEWRERVLKQAVLESVGHGGVLMIPAFSLERTQELLYELNSLAESNQIPKVPIFLDSPLAIKAVAIYKKHFTFFDEQAREKIKAGDDLFNFPGLEYTKKATESRRTNRVSPPKIIIAGSGMCTGGRMVYHLKLNLPNPKNRLLIISYQAEHTLGRQLLEGAKTVMIEGVKVPVRAKVSVLGSYSSHADQPKLLYWLKQINNPQPQKIFINHGEEKAGLMLKEGIKKRLELESETVELGRVYEI